MTAMHRELFDLNLRFYLNSFLLDPLEGDDWDLLQVSIQEILKASVMAGVNVMSSPLSSLLDTAKDLCSCLPILVPNALYLPSPPLYCPQPSPNTQVPNTQDQLLYALCLDINVQYLIQVSTALTFL